jgi:UDP-N-acetylglucosamine--N-acetylmuramyl-(pentapeptide) pyrophosphoryl-undecaprenol N-acetylglucosamine transferase
LKIVIAGGGTAGHINPGLAIAHIIKEKIPEAQIVFVGTEKGLENDLVPREGFPLEVIRVRGFRRKLSFDTVKSVKALFVGLQQARSFLKQFKPNLVIGTGGYVCGPVLFYASRMKIPTFIHEQNAFPGVTNRILSRFVDVVAIAFQDAHTYFKSSKEVVYTGNPIRKELLFIDKEKARKRLGLSMEEKFVVVFGGSRGAAKINEVMVEILKNRHEGDFKFHFCTGQAGYQAVLSHLEGFSPKEASILSYIYNMQDVLAAADLVVCRAGAITISELSAMGVPSILIPSPYVTANHQEYNAMVLENASAGVMIREKDLTAEMLYQKIKELLFDQALLKQMSINGKKIAVVDSAQRIFDRIQVLV